jgi:hypothetical protein
VINARSITAFTRYQKPLGRRSGQPDHASRPAPHGETGGLAADANSPRLVAESPVQGSLPLRGDGRHSARSRIALS